jgi:transposase
MGFVMVLSWSRMIYVHFFSQRTQGEFLRGHVGAFNAWGGLTRVVLYDNLKSAVLERQGQAKAIALYLSIDKKCQCRFKIDTVF